MKTLYLTDLDGTLLNNNASLSQKTISILNRLLSEGVFFSLATARTYATVIPMFKDVTLQYPIVLMNGVCIYDPLKKETLCCHSININSVRQILNIFDSFHISPMLYFEKDSHITVEYKELYNKAQADYVNLRQGFFNKSFLNVKDFSLSEKSNIVYCVYLDSREKVEPIYNMLCSVRDISCNFYPDNYTGYYFLEIFAGGVSKLSGAIQVKKMLGCDRIVAFGDNINDLPLLENADEGYAVDNASDEVKRRSSGVIGKNTEDAVAVFLEKRFRDGLINT